MHLRIYTVSVWLLGLIVSAGIWADTIHVPKSALSSEIKTMDFLIDNYFNERDVENPKVRRVIEQKIKSLNPHIIDWNYLQDSTLIMYEKKSPDYALSLGGGTNYFSDDNIVSSSNYYNIMFELNYHFKYRYFGFFNLKYNEYTHQIKQEEDYTFDKSQTLGYELGVTKIFPDPNWQMSLSLHKESVGTLSSILAQPGVGYTTQALYGEVVQNSRFNFLWLTTGLEYFFTLFKTNKTGSLQGVYGYSLSGNLSADGYDITETVTAHKFDLNYKQFFYKKLWAKLNLHQTVLYSTLNLSYLSFELSMGISF